MCDLCDSVDADHSKWHSSEVCACTVPDVDTTSHFSASRPVDIELMLHGLNYSQDVSYLLSTIAGWSYCDCRTFTGKLKYYGFSGATVTQIQVINDALFIVANVYFILTTQGVGILSFRGTEPQNVMNWLTNANTMMVPFMGGKVHRGFLDNTVSVWGQIVNCLNKSMSCAALKGLYITGHSLGGAMAVIAAAKLYQLDTPLKEKLKGVYTYGQPMVGDAVFAEVCARHLKRRYFRHVFSRDPIPHLPPKYTGDYVHFGEEWYAEKACNVWEIRKEKTTQIQSAVGAFLGVGYSFIAKRVKLPVFDGLSQYAMRTVLYSIDDHIPSNYIEVSWKSRYC